MKFIFWGVRGSIPSPGPRTARYGGNTTCIEVRTDDNTLIVIDGGTGIFSLAQSLLQNKTTPIHANIFITHSHWDHIHGLPFFTPLFVRGSRVRLHGVTDPVTGNGIEHVMGVQLQNSYFPVSETQMDATIEYRTLTIDEPIQVGDATVHNVVMNHPVTDLGYRIECNMDGESRELTVLFVDVRGFTTISEGLTPKQLREYINLYLTAMSEDIRDSHRGTLDKYIGDAVMAFWGAPVAFPDHASRAVATSLLMQASARRLNEDFVARGWPPLKIGIGLNTGLMHVGDMGSKIRRAYTVMGDAVNLGSRLEGITKVYGVGIAVGEATRAAAPEYAYRELDLVRVKGKHEPVAIFEPIVLDKDVDPATRDELERWHAALAAVRMQQWDQAMQIIVKLQEIFPERSLYSLYTERINFYRAHPPGADWDGVTTFETK